MEQWANYFIATASAAAALTGLIFVSVSLNLKMILSMIHLPGRALGSLVLMANILIVSSFCLIPKQSLLWLGIEVLVLGIGVWLILTSLDVQMYRGVEKLYKPHYLQNIYFSQFAIIPYPAAAICFILNLGIAPYLLVAGVTFSFIKSLLDSWVLLVEINR
jgi:hypothetical protein